MRNVATNFRRNVGISLIRLVGCLSNKNQLHHIFKADSVTHRSVVERLDAVGVDGDQDVGDEGVDHVAVEALLQQVQHPVFSDLLQGSQVVLQDLQRLGVRPRLDRSPGGSG